MTRTETRPARLEPARGRRRVRPANAQVPAPEQSDPRRWRALAVTQLAAFMVLLDVSIVNVALPSIQRDMAMTPTSAQWIVSGYALTLGLTLVPAGRLGDSLGRRRMFLIAVSAFVVTSAVTGAAPTAGLLIVARLVQGVAGGLLIPQNSALIQELFRGPERGRAFGFLGGTVGLATAAGPVVGGLILGVATGADGWRWVFYVNVPIGVVALALAARLVPATPPRAGAGLDLFGSFLLGAGVLCLLWPLVNADSGGVARYWWLWAATALLFSLFSWWERRMVRRSRQPLLDPRLVRTPGYAVGTVIGLIYFIGFTGVWLVLALFLQDGLGYSPLRSGLTVTPFALGVAVSAVVAGRFVASAGRWLTVGGLVAVAAGLLVTALVLRHTSPDAVQWAIAVPLLVAGLGGGLVTSPNLTLTLQNVPVVMAGAAGGAVQTAQRVGASIGTAALAMIFYHTLVSSGGDDAVAASDAVLSAVAFAVAALVLAAAELARRRRETPPGRPEGSAADDSIRRSHAQLHHA